MKTYDFIIVGAGVVGLTIARTLAERRYGSVLILEKEPELGRHASGRNSGVLHTGIYYSTDSLKAKLCGEGARLLFEYASERGIQVRKTGKVILPTGPGQERDLQSLYDRARANGAHVEWMDQSRLRQIEPEARACERALYSPETAVIDSLGVLSSLERENTTLGCALIKSAPVLKINSHECQIVTPNETFQYGYLINTAGLYADRIAHWLGVGRRYRILPFKGIYKKLKPEVAKRFCGAIYPVPDLGMPFLGVHLTKTISNEVLVGPTAIPALGRENYGIFEGMQLKDSSQILADLSRMWFGNSDGFRSLVRNELKQYSPHAFLKSAQVLAPNLKRDDLAPGQAMVGIRAQLIDCTKMKLVMDFVIEHGEKSTHVLNAISPAFTSSLAFAKLVVEGLPKNL